jgi:hypothetical protein
MRSRALIAGGLCVSPLLIVGCKQVLGLEEESFLRDAGEADAAPPPPEEPDTGLAPFSCPAGTKDCAGTCVALDKPEFGCAAKECQPCSLSNATAKCSAAGKCGVATCAQGRDDCNGVPEDGCEADLLAPTTCGTCTRNCPVAAPLCGLSGPAITCLAACEGSDVACSGSCVDTKTNASHCGACNNVCASAPNADPRCAASTCAITCRANFDQCDGNVVNGCEPLAVFYKDFDNDGYGLTAMPSSACTKPAGYAVLGGDCLDTNAGVRPNQTDFTGVGYASAGGSTSYDYNCDGVETEAPGFPHFTSCNADCSSPPQGYNQALPARPAGAGVNAFCGSSSAIGCSSSSGSGSCSGSSTSLAPIRCR